ncbi:tyrosine-type recombinase/integrase [Dorea formicigenerans]|nr:tyrosine-type recombinase/integrase [Dorea formicigenerans]
MAIFCDDITENNLPRAAYEKKKNTPIRQTDTDLVMQLISKRIEEKHEGFKPLTPHTLRHTFATRCIERGMNPKTLQVIMGHSSVNITMNLYCHVTEDTLFTEMEKFEAGSQNDTNVPNGVKVV